MAATTTTVSSAPPEQHNLQAAYDTFNAAQLPQPQQSAYGYFAQVSQKPAEDRRMSEVCGKAVKIYVKLTEETKDAISIRGEGIAALRWDRDYPSDPVVPTTQNFFERSFTIHAQASEIDKTMSYKYVKTVSGKLSYQEGLNNTVNLKDSGHHVTIESSNVSFEK